jgi:hypothetical protein
MALGDKTSTITNGSFRVELLASVTATNGAPSGASAGIDCNSLRIAGGAPIPDAIRVGIKSTAGSGTMTVAARVWLYAGGDWFVAQALAADPATPYTPGTIPETSNDSISYSEWVFGLSGAARIYLEITAIAGTSTAVTGYAIVG